MRPDIVQESANPLAEPFLLAEHDGCILHITHQVVDTLQRFPEAIGGPPNFSRVVHGQNFVPLATEVTRDVHQMVDHVLSITHLGYFRGLG